MTKKIVSVAQPPASLLNAGKFTSRRTQRGKFAFGISAATKRRF
jgi:hypothetical protein